MHFVKCKTEVNPAKTRSYEKLEFSFSFNQLYFKKSCKVAIENALFLTKENPVELKKDLYKLKDLVTGKGAEFVPDIAIYCDKEMSISSY